MVINLIETKIYPYEKSTEPKNLLSPDLGNRFMSNLKYSK